MENTNETVVEQQEANAPNVEIESAVTTQPQAVNVDNDAVIEQATKKATEAAEKKMEAVFKSMLSQQGLDTDTINKMADEWKAKQKTPELELQETKESLAAEQGKNTILERQMIAMDKGVPKDKASRYLKLAETYMDDKTGFEAALDSAITEFPLVKDEAAPYAAGTGSKPLSGDDQDEITKRISKYKQKE